MRLIAFVLNLLEAPSRVRRMEGEVAHLRRQVGVLMRAEDARSIDEMERRLVRGLSDSRAVMAGHPTTRLPSTQGAAPADAKGGQP